MVDRIDSKGAFANLITPTIENKKNSSFLNLLKGYLKNVDMEQHKADKAIGDFLAGKKEIHEVMISVEEADISFRLFLKIRNKLIEAYQEIMRMQV